MKVTKSLILILALASTFNVMAASDPPCCNLGDADADGDLDNRDLLEMTKHLQGLTCMDGEEQCKSDVDGDGMVTNDDLVLLQEYILGLRDTFPRCGDLDGDGTLEWESGGDDVHEFTGCFVKGKDCPNADADNDGDYDNDDVWLFGAHADGFISDFPGCACGEGACG